MIISITALLLTMLTQTNIIGRYKNINNPQGNSPIAPPGATYVDASTLYPDQEDLDHDNTMNELEEYFEYKVDLIPSKMRVGQNFITDSRKFLPERQSTHWKPGTSSGFRSMPIRKKWVISRISNRSVLSGCI